MSYFWNNPLLDNLLTLEIQGRRDSYEALRASVSPQMARNAAAIAQSYQQFPASIVQGLAVAGVSADDPAVMQLGDRLAQEAAGQGRGTPGVSVGYNVQEKDAPGFFGRIGDGIKAGVKGLFLAFDFLWEEGLQRPARAAVGNYQANRPWYEVVFAPFFPKAPGYQASGPSIGNIALHAAMQGQKVNLGTGWFLDSTLAPETERRLSEGTSFMQAIANPEQMELGVPISQLQRHWREQTQIAAGPDRAETIAFSPGRLIATQFMDQKENEVNMVSGVIDFAANIVMDPSNIFLGSVAKARKASKVIIPNGRVPQVSRSGLLNAAVKEGQNPTLFGSQTLGKIESSLNRPFARTWDEWLATPHGRRTSEDLASIMDWGTMFDILRKSEQGVTPGMPQIVSALRQATDPDEVAGILSRMGEKAVGLSHVPSPQSLIGRATGRQATPIVNAASAALGRGVAPAARRLGGPVFSMRYALEGTWMGRQMAQVGAKAIDVNDIERGFTDLQEWMRGAGFSGERISYHLQALADAQARLNVYDRFEHVTNVAQGDHYDTVFSVVTGMVDEWSDMLVASGLPEAGVRAFGRIFKDAKEMRNYFRNAADNAQFFPGAKMEYLADGSIHTVESAHLWSEFLNRAIPLPDARQVRVAMRRAGINEKSERVGAYLNRNVTDWDTVGENALVTLGDFYMQKIWKPMVLLRAAWPVRVVGEEQLRMAVEGLANVFTHPIQTIAWGVAKNVGDIDIHGLKMLDAKAFQETMSGKGLLNLLDHRGARAGTDQWLSTRRGDQRHTEGVHNILVQLHNDPVARTLAGGPTGYHAPMDDLTSAFHPYLDDQVPRLQRAQAFDALPDESSVWVFHATDRELAGRMLADGYSPGDYKGISTGAIEADVLYVTTDFRKAKQRYGEGELVAMRVPKSHLRAPVEAHQDPRMWYGGSEPTTGLAVVDAGHGAVIHAPVPADRIYRIDPIDYDGKPTPIQLISKAVKRSQTEALPVREMSVEDLFKEFGGEGELAFHGTDSVNAQAIVGEGTPAFDTGGVTGSLREASGFADYGPEDGGGAVVVWLRKDLHPAIRDRFNQSPGYVRFEGDVSRAGGAGVPIEHYKGLDAPLAVIEQSTGRAYVYPRAEMVGDVPVRAVGPAEVKQMFLDGDLAHIRAAMASEGGNRSLLNSQTYSDGYIDSVYARLHYSTGGDYMGWDPWEHHYWDSRGQAMTRDEVEVIMGEPLLENDLPGRLQDRTQRGPEVVRDPKAQELVARDELSRLADVFRDEDGNFDREAFATINHSFGHMSPMDPVPTDWADDVYLVGEASAARHNRWQTTALEPGELPSAQAPTAGALQRGTTNQWAQQTEEIRGVADDLDVVLQQLDEAMATGDADTVSRILQDIIDQESAGQWAGFDDYVNGIPDSYPIGEWIDQAFPYPHPGRPPIKYAADEAGDAFRRFELAVRDGDDFAASEAMSDWQAKVQKLADELEREAGRAATSASEADGFQSELDDFLEVFFADTGDDVADAIGMEAGVWEEMANALAAGDTVAVDRLVADVLEDTATMLEGTPGNNGLAGYAVRNLSMESQRHDDLIVLIEEAHAARTALARAVAAGERSEAMNAAEELGVGLMSVKHQIDELKQAGEWGSLVPGPTHIGGMGWNDPVSLGSQRAAIMGRSSRPGEGAGYQFSNRIRPTSVYVVRDGHITARMEFTIGGQTSSVLPAKEAAERGIIHVQLLEGPGAGDPAGRTDVAKLFRLLIERDLLDPETLREMLMGDHSVMEVAKASAKYLMGKSEDDIPKTWEGLVDLIHRSGGAVGAWAMPENKSPTMTMLSSELMGRILNQMTRRGGHHTNPLHVDNLRHNRVEFNVTRNGNSELGQAVATGKLRGMDITDPKNYPEIYRLLEDEFADSLPHFGKVTKKPDHNLASQWDDTVSKMFGWLMSKPTNYLSRSPAFRQYYWRKIGELMPLADSETQATMLMRAKEAGIGKDSMLNMIRKIAKGDGELADEQVIKALEKMISEGGGGIAVGKNLASQGGLAGSIQDIDHLDDVAKAFALEQTRRLLYDLSKKSNFFDMTRVIFPFGEAWYEIISTWGRLIRENPQALRRLQQGVEGARESGFFYEDPNTGEEVFNYPGADLMAKWMFDSEYQDQQEPGDQLGRGDVAAPQMTGRVLGLNLMLGSWIPGMGPVVQIPASQLGFLQEPDWKFVRELVLPFGATDVESIGGLIDTQLPAWFRKALVALGKPTGDDERLFGNTVIDVYRTMLLNGADDSTPEAASALMEEAKKKAKMIYRIRALAQFAGPTGANVRWDATDKEGKTWALQSLATEYRVILDKNDFDQPAAFREFVKIFGLDPSGLYTAKTRSVRRRSVTEEGYVWEFDNKALFEEFPLTAYYGRPDDPDEPFDYNAYLKQLKDQNRVPLTPEQWTLERNDFLGRIAYEKARREAQVYGTSVAVDAWLRNIRYQLMNRYPGFNQPLVGGIVQADRDQVILELERWRESPELLATETGQGVALYMDARDFAKQQAEWMGLSPLGFQSAARTRQLRDWLRTIAQDAIRQYPDFGVVWDQVLSSELSDESSEFNLMGASF